MKVTEMKKKRTITLKNGQNGYFQHQHGNLIYSNDRKCVKYFKPIHNYMEHESPVYTWDDVDPVIGRNQTEQKNHVYFFILDTLIFDISLF